jgi:hypothetical protein
MIVASTSMVKINGLAQLDRTFEMKDLRAAKQILGIEIHREEENDKRILMRFSMSLVSLVNGSLTFIVIFLQDGVLVIRKKEGMSRVQYARSQVYVCDEKIRYFTCRELSVVT